MRSQPEYLGKKFSRHISVQGRSRGVQWHGCTPFQTALGTSGNIIKSPQSGKQSSFPLHVQGNTLFLCIPGAIAASPAVQGMGEFSELLLPSPVRLHGGWALLGSCIVVYLYQWVMGGGVWEWGCSHLCSTDGCSHTLLCQILDLSLSVSSGDSFW